MNSREFEEFIKRNPGEAMRLISKAFKPRELLTVGNRSYVDAYKYPESRFDPRDLCSDGHNCPPDPDMLQPLSDPGKLFTDKYVIPPSSIIFTWANRIYDKKWWGEVAGGLTDAKTVIQAALDGLTAGRTEQENIQLKGNFTINGPIAISDYVKMIGPSKLTLAKNSNCHMIVNKDQVTNGNAAVGLESIRLDGNASDQSGAGPYYGIFWNNVNGGTPIPFQVPTWPRHYTLDLVDVGIKATKGSAFRIEDSTVVWMDRCRDETGIEASARGLDLYLVDDSWFNDCRFAGNQYAAYFYYGTTNQFVNIYFAGSNVEDGVFLAGCSFYNFSNCRSDASRKHGWHLAGWNGCKRIIFVACYASTLDERLAADNTYSGWYVESGTSLDGEQIQLSACEIIHRGVTTRRWKYGIEEADANLANCQYVTIMAIDPVSGGARILSPSSEYGHIQGGVVHV